jgi:hypothetical protein
MNRYRSSFSNPLPPPDKKIAINNLNVSQTMCDSCSFKPNGEGEEGNDHDGLDMEDHVDRVGQAHVGLLHYQLGQRPPYTGQEAEKKLC